MSRVSCAAEPTHCSIAKGVPAGPLDRGPCRLRASGSPARRRLGVVAAFEGHAHGAELVDPTWSRPCRSKWRAALSLGRHCRRLVDVQRGLQYTCTGGCHRRRSPPRSLRRGLGSACRRPRPGRPVPWMTPNPRIKPCASTYRRDLRFAQCRRPVEAARWRSAAAQWRPVRSVVAAEARDRSDRPSPSRRWRTSRARRQTGRYGALFGAAAGRADRRLGRAWPGGDLWHAPRSRELLARHLGAMPLLVMHPHSGTSPAFVVCAPSRCSVRHVDHLGALVVSWLRRSSTSSTPGSAATRLWP
jgi:hypothetical protein